jgi:CelD/BcsL family acetyltransferase involved in cellulose biosynthesis
MAFDVEIMRMEAMGPAEEAAWRRLQAAHSLYANPFHDIGFSRAVAAVRTDVRVALLHEGGVVCGLWPFHRRRLGYAQPIGAPLSDWQGPLLDPRFAVDPPALLARMGVAATRLSNLADPHETLAAAVCAAEPAYVADLSCGLEAFFDGLAKGQIKNMRRCQRRVESEHGAVVAGRVPAQGEALAEAIAWKRAQYAATGRHDVLKPRWVAALLERLGGFEDPGFRLELWRLAFGERIAAVELVLRAGREAQSWFPAYDKAFAAYSPGHLLAEAVFRGLAAEGVARVHYGPGHGDYKSRITNATIPIHTAVIHAASPLGRARRFAARAWSGLEAAGSPAAAVAPRLRRRLDLMVQAEASWTRAGWAALQLAVSRA